MFHSAMMIPPEHLVQFDAFTSHSKQLLLHASQKPLAAMNLPTAQSPPGYFVQFVASPLHARQFGSQREQYVPSLK